MTARARFEPRGRDDGRSRSRWALTSAVVLLVSLLAGSPAQANDATAGATSAVTASAASADRPPASGVRRVHHRHHRRRHHHRHHRHHHRHHHHVVADRTVSGTRTRAGSPGTNGTVLTTSTGTGTTTPGTVPTGGAPSTLGLLAIGNDQPQHLGDVRPYRYVALQHWFGDIVDRIHATSPTTEAVAYFEAAAVRDQDCASAGYDVHVPYDSAPVNYCWVQRFHPDWFLRDRSGQPLHFSDYPEYVAVDVTQPAYRQLWLDNAVRLARANHFDGILFDDITIGVAHGLSGRIAGWTDQAYGTAMADFGAWIGDHLRAHGLVAMANAGIDPWVSWEVTSGLRLASHVDVLNREFTIRWGSCSDYSALFTDPATQGNPPLSMIEDFQRRVQTAGAGIGSVDYADTLTSSSDVAAMVYGRANFLLTWDGASPSAYFFRDCGTGDPAAAGWMAEPGAPTSGVQQRDGLLVRTFTGGAVVLNASTGARPLPSDLAQGYVDSTGRATSAGQSVGPHSALVLLRR